MENRLSFNSFSAQNQSSISSNHIALSILPSSGSGVEATEDSVTAGDTSRRLDVLVRLLECGLSTAGEFSLVVSSSWS